MTMEDLKIGEEEPVQPVCGGGPLPWASAARQAGPRHGHHTTLGVAQVNIVDYFKVRRDVE